jgi:mono/diheme cytochrome c family protein
MGSLCVPNITPDPTYGIGAWTDGEVIRAIREGIGRDGRALTSVMPFSEYRAMSDEDVRSVVAYLRSLPPIKKGVEKPLVVAFPLSVISKIFPKPVEGPQATPAPGSPEYGKYLVNVAGCAPCHGSDPFTKTFEGGFDQSGPWGHAVGRNITPDMDTGIGIIPREAFIGRFKSHLEVDPTALADPHKGSPMPWGMFAGMSEEDLGAIYDYLRTVKPVKNAVVP